MKEHPYLTFGPTSDGVGIAALVLGFLLLIVALVRGRALDAALDRLPSRWFVVVLGIVSAGLSWLYVAHYLGGGPRIIDAAAYWLEARVIAAGHLAFDVPEPSGSFRGRFLLPTPDGRLSVIFPPGYPLLLALGFLVRSPLVVGPLVAFLLVIATYFTTRTLLGDERVARLAAVVSALCACLRYHTADTMSHGLSALLLALGIGCAVRKTKGSVALAGLFIGWLVATRPVTGVLAVVLGLVALRRNKVLVPILLFATVPGLALIAVHARVATGSWLGSTQLAYYALSDGPPGCFRWGFGSGIGCRFEHGDFVKEHLANGFGPLEASFITFERLTLHAIDVSNLVPLSLLAPWAAFRFRKEPGVLMLALVPVLVVLAYAPFYYPASYPGAGARLFADALPFEHALVALALTRLRVGRFAPAAMLLGFALHAVHEHVALAEREGGNPMFSASALGEAQRGLLFVGTDHGFLLGHDPRAKDARTSLVVARLRGDAHDRILWQRLGRPPAYRYDYDTDRGTTAVSRYDPNQASDRYEAEAEWPPLAVANGWAHPDFRECLSRGQGLHLRKATVDLELVPPAPGRYALSVGWLADPSVQLRVAVGGSRASLGGPPGAGGSGCRSESALPIEAPGPIHVRLEAAADVIVDYLSLSRIEAKKR